MTSTHLPRFFGGDTAAGDETGVFNGICGAESGGVPVAALSPALLVKKIETQNQFAIDIDEPILQTPTEK